MDLSPVAERAGQADRRGGVVGAGVVAAVRPWALTSEPGSLVGTAVGVAVAAPPQAAAASANTATSVARRRFFIGSISSKWPGRTGQGFGGRPYGFNRS